MPSLDASSPAHVITTSNSGRTQDTGTTAAFSPPADSWIYVDVGANQAIGAAITFSLPTNTGTALSWALIGSTTNASGGGCGSYRAYNANAQAGITVSLTLTYTPGGGGAPANSAGMDVEVWTGCARDQTGAANTSSTGTAKTNNPSLTTTRQGSRVRLVGLDWSAGGNPTSSDTIKPYTVATQVSGALAYKAADSGAPGSVSVNYVCAGASGINSFLIYEILAPAVGGAPLTPILFILSKMANRQPWLMKPLQIADAIVAAVAYAWVGTGGITFSGTAPVSKGKIFPVAGGLTFAGTASYSKGKVFAVSGGLVFGGVATTLFTSAGITTFTYTPSGGFVFGGAATLNKGKVFAPSGGLVLAGSAVLLKAKVYSPSGGLVFSGTAVLQKGKVYVVSGGLNFSGGGVYQFSGTIVPDGVHTVGSLVNVGTLLNRS